MRCGDRSFFVGTDDILESIAESCADDSFVEPIEDPDARGSTFEGDKVNWWSDSSYVVMVATSRILFMDGNQWNQEHGAGVIASMRAGNVFEIPAGRVYRITANDVKESKRLAKKCELEEQLGMERPWDSEDVGQYYAQLLDGNHRAAAAMILGEDSIPVYVSENYRDNIRKKDWL